MKKNNDTQKLNNDAPSSAGNDLCTVIAELISSGAELGDGHIAHIGECEKCLAAYESATATVEAAASNARRALAHNFHRGAAALETPTERPLAPSYLLPALASLAIALVIVSAAGTAFTPNDRRAAVSDGTMEYSELVSGEIFPSAADLFDNATGGDGITASSSSPYFAAGFNGASSAADGDEVRSLAANGAHEASPGRLVSPEDLEWPGFSGQLASSSASNGHSSGATYEPLCSGYDFSKAFQADPDGSTDKGEWNVF